LAPVSFPLFHGMRGWETCPIVSLLILLSQKG